jgi:hypothetical protein
MDHEELGHFNFILLNPASLTWRFHPQLIISQNETQNETHPVIKYNF